MPTSAKFVALAIAFLYLLLVAHSVLNHSVRVAFLEDIARDDLLPSMTNEALPMAQYSPLFLAGLVPAMLVLFPTDRTMRETIMLLSSSALLLVVFAGWMAWLYIGIDLVYGKFHAVQFG